MYSAYYTVVHVFNAFVIICIGKTSTQGEGIFDYADVMQRTQFDGFKYPDTGKQLEFHTEPNVHLDEFYSKNNQIPNFKFNENPFGLSNDKRSKSGFKFSGIGKRTQDYLESNSDFSTYEEPDKKAAGFRYAGIGKRSKEDSTYESDYNKRKTRGRRNSFVYAGIGKRDAEELDELQKRASAYRFAGLGKRPNGNYQFAGIGKRISNGLYDELNRDFTANNDMIKRAMRGYSFAGIGKKSSAFRFAGMGKRNTERDFIPKRGTSFRYAGLGKRDNNMRFAGIGKRDQINEMDAGTLAELTFPKVEYFDDGEEDDLYHKQSKVNSADVLSINKRSSDNKDTQ